MQSQIEAEGKRASIAQLCRWFGVPRSSFYDRPEAPATGKEPVIDAELVETIRPEIEGDPAFGVRRITVIVRRKCGAPSVFVSLLASCGLHKIELWGYLRDLFCLLPGWPRSKVLELAPAYWKKTLEDADTQQRLAATPSAKRLSTTRSIPSSRSPLRRPRQRRGT